MTDRPTTEDLIRRLADAPPPPTLPPRVAALPILAGLGLTLALFLSLAGLRDGLGPLLVHPEVAVKILVPLTLAAVAMPLAWRSAHPGRALRPGLLLLPAVAAVGLFLMRLVQTPFDRIVADLMGHSAAACLFAITGLSAPATVAGLLVFRRGAALRPALTGGLIGMAASAGAAAGYALYCTEDSALFFTIWYGLAIMICTALGALAGRRLLRW